MPRGTVLIADDDPVIAGLVETLLDRAGFTVIHMPDGQEALRAAYDRKPDLVILDVNMPKLDGWTVLSRLREVSAVPVLMLTDEDSEMSKVRGLREGADDYVAKPFQRQELLARVEALIRRAQIAAPAGPEVTRSGPLEVRHDEGVVSVAGEEIALTPLEFRLLSTFVRNPRQVLSADRIVELVWRDPYTAQDQVKLLVGRLRKKLADPLGAEVIETVRGFGYRFNPPG
jgi:DNA-binding response OmpR family regulator